MPHSETPTQSPPQIASRCFPPRPGNKPGYRDPVEQGIDWQRALNDARASDPRLCVPLAQGARAWVEVERLKREIKMKPKPKAIDVSDGRNGRGARARARGEISFTPMVEEKKEATPDA